MKHRVVVISLIVFTALAAAACGRGGGQQPAGQAPPSAGQPAAPAAGQPAAPAAQPAASQVINASEQEWSITLTPATVSAGTYQFVIKNNGTINHNFVIQGLNARTDQDPPGETKTMTVTLKPGTYTIICDIAGHEEAGMKTVLTVK